jgi:hypothetical protein
MTSGKPLPSSDIFVISMICTFIAAFANVIVIVAMGLRSGIVPSSVLPLLASFVFVFFAFMVPTFLVAFVALTVVFNLIVRFLSGSLIRWIFFPAAGLGMGLGIPFVVGLVAGEPKTAAIGGLFGGFACAWLWGRVARYRERVPVGAETPDHWLRSVIDRKV